MSDPEDAERKEPMYDLTLTGNGLSVDKSIPESQASQVMSIVMGGTVGPVAPIGQGTRAARPVVADGVSIREFLDDVGATKNPQIIASAVAYLADTRSMKTAPVAEIRAQFQDAGERPPANFSRDLRDTKVSSWIAEDPNEPGSYFITRAGRDAISKKFEGQKIRRPRRKGGARKSAEDPDE